jgi:hypothetical protein
MSDPLLHPQQLLAAIAPELWDVRVTLPPAGYPVPRGLYAFSIGRPDELLAAHLGLGDAVFVPTIVLTSIPDDRDDILGVALHEAAHLVPWPTFPPGSAAIGYRPAAEAETIAAIYAEPRHAGPDPGHGADFVRCAIHLHARAASAGVEIPYPALRIGWQYHLPPTAMLARALGDEPERMQHTPFIEVLRTPAPAAFTRFFEER